MRIPATAPLNVAELLKVVAPPKVFVPFAFSVEVNVLEALSMKPPVLNVHSPVTVNACVKSYQSWLNFPFRSDITTQPPEVAQPEVEGVSVA